MKNQNSFSAAPVVFPAAASIILLLFIFCLAVWLDNSNTGKIESKIEAALKWTEK